MEQQTITIIVGVTGPLVSLFIAMLVHMRLMKKANEERAAEHAAAGASVQNTIMETFADNLRELQDALTKRQTTIDEQNSQIEELRRDLIRKDELSRDLFVEVQVHRAWAMSIPIPYWCKTVSCRFVFVNRSWEKFTGLSLDDVAGRSNTELGLPSEVAEDWQRGDERAVAANGKLHVENERSTNASGDVVSGRSGKWLMQVQQLGGKPFIMGCYISNDFWGLHELESL